MTLMPPQTTPVPTLEDKYRQDDGAVFLTGSQALVRLALVQRRRDQAAGLNTAGYVTGYRGSPLGNVDREFGRATHWAKSHDITVWPAINEDLAATALWGSQQVGLFPGARHDGVFGLWYGKGPGVDRSGDAFRHANLAGTSAHGGVLALMGDDPGCKSSTVASSSEYAFVDAQIPVLNPAGVAEIIEYGLLGWAMSRYAGLWVSLKCIADNVESSARIGADHLGLEIRYPTDFEFPKSGVHIRWPDPALAQEKRLTTVKLPAAVAFARANVLDRVVVGGARPQLVIVSTGKSYLDVRQALEDLGLDDAAAAALGICLYKVAMPWPLEPEGLRAACEGAREILVVEEKRPLMEDQIKQLLYHWPADRRPEISGKTDPAGAPLLPGYGEHSATMVAKAIAGRLGLMDPARAASLDEKLARIDRSGQAGGNRPATASRIPYFCSGCPHNSSTRVPEGSRASAGIGCHTMTVWMNRNTSTYTHMGAEGVNWVGQAPFTNEPHIFVNMGDGTYFHSGLLAIRAAVSSGANVTYKILYNDAVALTGGQPMDGPLDPAIITRQLHGEGVRRIAVVTDEPEKYPVNAGFAPWTTVHHRHDLDAVQRELREVKGVSAIVYDQTCAAEKRRRRKRGTYPDPARRVVINEQVCEGCGDCGDMSNCVSVIPLETDLGRKRAIDQSSCNKDFSCVDGFCPSFVSVLGAELKAPAASAAKNSIKEAPFPPLPTPDFHRPDDSHGILVAGIGGTGVITIGAILGMAAHLDGRNATVLDQTGLSQKNGAVFSHLRIAPADQPIHAVRLSTGGADLLLGCDMVAAASSEALGHLAKDRSQVVVNGHATMTADFLRQPDMAFPGADLSLALQGAVGPDRTDFVDSQALSTALLGNSIGANMLLVGRAWQQGLIPIALQAIEQAIELNGVAVAFNKAAFLWGRRSAVDPQAVIRLAGLEEKAGDEAEMPSLDDFITDRMADLTAYGDAGLARRYQGLVDKVRQEEKTRVPGQDALAWAVARSYFKLLACKDEYEVARLLTSDRFEASLRSKFGDDFTINYHLAPPLLARPDPISGRPAKRRFGPWLRPWLKGLAGLKGLRGTALDVFGYTEERRRERRMITDFEARVVELLAVLDPRTHDLCRAIATLPQSVRGFGPVKLAAIKAFEEQEAVLLDQLHNGSIGRGSIGRDAAE